MKKAYLLALLLLFIFISPANASVKHSVVYGEHANKIKTIENNTYRIFMDMNGHYYPENVISNKELASEGKSKLAIWSKKYPSKFQSIAESYNLINTSYSEDNYLILQDSIISTITRGINQFKTSQQTWIIHGFRKKISNENIDNSTSTLENKICRNRINDFLLDSLDNLNIEVYWDGKYLKRGGLIRTIRLGLLFKNKAIPNAKHCGYSLRNVFEGIQCQHINIITHSTGTFVGSSLLFNLKRSYTLPTPNQSNIRIALTASASPGKKLFKRYYNRNTHLNYKDKDNYSLFNFINENDFVLLKTMGTIKLPRVLGNTTLGCNFKNESGKLKDYFAENFNGSYFGEGYNRENAYHSFSTYIGSEGFDDVLEFLYE